MKFEWKTEFDETAANPMPILHGRLDLEGVTIKSTYQVRLCLEIGEQSTALNGWREQIIFHGLAKSKKFDSAKILKKPGENLQTFSSLCKLTSKDSKLTPGDITVKEDPPSKIDSSGKDVHIEFTRPFIGTAADSMDIKANTDYKFYMSYYIYTSSSKSSSRVKGDQNPGKTPKFIDGTIYGPPNWKYPPSKEVPEIKTGSGAVYRWGSVALGAAAATVASMW